jgi:GDP-mannose 6-dehydrogenase
MIISVVGLGYVGAVSAACLASRGHRVWGVDISPEKVRIINEGGSPIVESGLAGKIAQ